MASPGLAGTESQCDSTVDGDLDRRIRTAIKRRRLRRTRELWHPIASGFCGLPDRTGHGHPFVS